MQMDRVNRVNGHVTRLGRFLPFSPAHDQIYEEYQSEDDALDLDTVAIEYAKRALAEGARCIVLTGDAGHGKTHMCRRLLQEYLGYSGAEARVLLNTACDGETVIPGSQEKSGVSIRVHKDFSETAPQRAAQYLEVSADEHGYALIVCANEGRLRAILNNSAAGRVAGKIRELFKRSFEVGVASEDGLVHVINLNYQSVAASAQATRSLVRRTLEKWVVDGRRWTQCATCQAEMVCPIRRNRAMLAEHAGLSELRIRRLEELCGTVERLGYVITIREMLMLLAYAITGGLACSEVHARQSSVGWQSAYSFYNAVFSKVPSLPADRLFKGIPVLVPFARLDPGGVASRLVDERLLNEGNTFPGGDLDLQFTVPGKGYPIDGALGIDDVIGNPQNRADLAREADLCGLVVSSLRRRAFFDDEMSTHEVLQRLGFRFGGDFLDLVAGRMSAQAIIRSKNLIVAGLHAVQGLRLSRTETMLHLVDPAFGRASLDAAIIARRIPTSALTLMRSGIAWEGNGVERVWSVEDSVDWIDRFIVLRVKDHLGACADLQLDLLAFECVSRAASGFVSEDFYASQLRRVRSFLGSLADRGKSTASQVSLFVGGSVQNVSLDMELIQVGGT